MHTVLFFRLYFYISTASARLALILYRPWRTTTKSQASASGPLGIRMIPVAHRPRGSLIRCRSAVPQAGPFLRRGEGW